MGIVCYIILSLTTLQCEADIDVIEKNIIDNIKGADPIENDIPLNWPWRGINIVVGPDVELNVSEQTIRDLRASGVNSIRLTIEARKYSIENDLPIEIGVNKLFNYFEQIIKWCDNEGIIIIIGSTDFPLDPLKNFDRRSLEFWESEVELEAALSYINQLVLKFDKYENVIAYDFFSEPVVVFGDGTSRLPEEWNSFFHRILKTIRNHSNKYVIYTPGVWGLPKGYRDFNEPINDAKVIYGFHFYNPHAYTHQGLPKRSKFYSYPRQIDNIYWDKNRISHEMNVVTKWAQQNNKLVYVGEFSVVRWAEGKEHYLEDVLKVFEENQMGYSYWNLNGWDGWKMDYEEETPGSRKLVKAPYKTKSRVILENFWKLNSQ